MRMVEIPICHLRTAWTFSTVTVQQWTKRTQTKEATIPAAEMRSGT